jgi:hypothetical protein
MCVDILIHALIMYILPSIFEERQLVSKQNSCIATLVRLLPGSTSLFEQKGHAKMVPAVPKVVYLVPDLEHDAQAWELVSHRQISTPVVLPGNRNVGFTLTPYSSCTLAVNTDPAVYTIQVGFNGVVSCSCPDFMDCG